MMPAIKKGDVRPGYRVFLWLLAFILAIILFLDGPGYLSRRSLCASWDLGHVIAFTLWSYLLLTGWKPAGETTVLRQWGIVLLFCLLLGGATELLQFLAGRDASYDDLLRDVAGGIIALSWFAPSGATLTRKSRQAVKIFAASVLLIACLPLASALIDEWIAKTQFPILADFETGFERNRWDSSARTSVDTSMAYHGNASLRVDLDTSTYSGAGLVHFPGNWKGYRYLVLEVFNPSEKTVDITCRIHDRGQEMEASRYTGRFIKVFRLVGGWNHLRIDLAEVASAPANRTMDLGEMRQVGLFATKLPAPRTVFVDYVRLQ